MLKIRSRSDVITNSSSEVFIVKSDIKPSKLKYLLEEHNTEESYSGMGGIIECFNNETQVTDYLWDWDDPNSEYYSEKYTHKPFRMLPQGYIAVHIDYGLGIVIKWLKDNYEVLGEISDKGECEKLFDKWVKSYWLTRKAYWDEILQNIKSEEDLKKIWNDFEKESECINYYVKDD